MKKTSPFYALTYVLTLSTVLVSCKLTTQGRDKVAQPAVPVEPREVTETWFAPMPFKNWDVSGREVRDDFEMIYKDPSSWEEIRSKTQVMKFYLMMLPDDSGVDLDAMVRMVNQAGLKVAFEVGGLRPFRHCGKGGGAALAAEELKLLKRWMDADGGRGRIDYLTTDHAIAQALEAGRRDVCHMTMREAAQEHAQYNKLAQELIPGVKIGFIESLGYWTFNSLDGHTKYGPTSGWLPEYWFGDMVDLVIEENRKVGVELEHFDLDLGFEGVRFDGQVHPNSGYMVNGRDYGRIITAMSAIQRRGLQSSVIHNAFHDGYVHGIPVQFETEEERLEASASAKHNSLTFAREMSWFNMSGRRIFQSWQPFPHLTGPETRDLSSLNVFRDALRETPLSPIESACFTEVRNDLDEILYRAADPWKTLSHRSAMGVAEDECLRSTSAAVQYYICLANGNPNLKVTNLLLHRRHGESDFVAVYNGSFYQTIKENACQGLKPPVTN